MNKNKISKIISIILTFTLIFFISTSVFAQDQLDLGTITGNDTNNSTGDDDIPDISFNTDKNLNENANANINSNENANANTNTNTQSTSTYKDSNIPYAGPADTALMISAFVVLGIIGIYTFIKLSEYSNI